MHTDELAHASDEHLQLYIFEGLPPREHATIARHLDSCASCQGRLVDSMRVPGRLAAIAGLQDKARPAYRPRSGTLLDTPATVNVLAPASSGRISARIMEMVSDGVRLRVTEFVAPGAVVRIKISDGLIFGEVLHCQPVGAAFRAFVQVRDSIRSSDASVVHLKRKEPRQPVAIRGLLRAPGDMARSVTVLDVSRSGLRLQSACPVAIGARVEIAYEKATVVGEVRYCRESVTDGYRLGVSARSVAGEDGVRHSEMDLTLLFVEDSNDSSREAAAGL